MHGKLEDRHGRVLFVHEPDLVIDQGGHRRCRLHLGSQLVEMVEGDVHELLWVGGRDELVFEAHGDQVVQLRTNARARAHARAARRKPRQQGAAAHARATNPLAQAAHAHLVHARLIEAHDRGVGEPIEDLAGRVHRVDLLRPKELLHERRVVHRADHVL